MAVDFKYLPEFERRAKALAKKYKSFIKDYDTFLDSLEKDPFQGTSLGREFIKPEWPLPPKGKAREAGHVY